VRLNHLRPYDGLTPDVVLDALESVGYRGDGRLLALNSYENRVYQVWLEDRSSVVAKFYRPARGTDAQILEEHAFATDLADREIPVVAPLRTDRATLHHFAGFRFAVYPRRGGRAPDLENPQTLEWVGRFLGRMHAVAATGRFRERPALEIGNLGTEPRDWLLATGLLPPDLKEAWSSVSAQALQGARRAWECAGAIGAVRLHGDCHVGNILWTDDGPHFVDLDDARTGPAVQDLWMLLPSEPAEAKKSLRALIAGYERFFAFERRELLLVEALRTLRLLHYSAWIAKRWDDPAFPAAFPWFGTQRYWQDRILELREQVAAMQEPPLSC